MTTTAREEREGPPDTACDAQAITQSTANFSPRAKRWRNAGKRAYSLGQRSLQGMIELVYPSLCLLCEQPLDVPFHDAMYCWSCRRRHLTALSSACYRCAARLPYRWHGEQRLPMVRREQTAEGCPDCRREKWAFSRTVALGSYFGRWRDHVYELKRPNRHVEAFQAGKLLAYPLLQSEWQTDYDALLPVPSHFRRRWSRGFNPAEEIAKGISWMTELPLLKNAVVCDRFAGKQGQLTRQQRLENVHGIFRIALPERLRGRSIILVDDVMTTGATMNQLARSCRRAGIARVAVAVVARACSQY